jgi:hypothetical protein
VPAKAAGAPVMAAVTASAKAAAAATMARDLTAAGVWWRD